MKRTILFVALAFLTCSSGEAQKPIPQGASDFFKTLGGLNLSNGKDDILQRIATNKIDKVEAGGGVVDWTEVDGRVFVRTTWMVEIGEMAGDFSSYDLEQSLAAEMRKKLTSDGFRLTPTKIDLGYVRYQKNFTVGTVEVRSFFLNSGNLPLRYEFIFNESYRPVRGSRNSRTPRITPRH